MSISVSQEPQAKKHNGRMQAEKKLSSLAAGPLQASKSMWLCRSWPYYHCYPGRCLGMWRCIITILSDTKQQRRILNQTFLLPLLRVSSRTTNRTAGRMQAEKHRSALPRGSIQAS